MSQFIGVFSLFLNIWEWRKNIKHHVLHKSLNWLFALNEFLACWKISWLITPVEAMRIFDKEKSGDCLKNLACIPFGCLGSKECMEMWNYWERQAGVKCKQYCNDKRPAAVNKAPPLPQTMQCSQNWQEQMWKCFISFDLFNSSLCPC